LPADRDDSNCPVSTGCSQESQFACFRVVATRGTPRQLPDDAPFVAKAAKELGYLWFIGGVGQQTSRPNLKRTILGQYSMKPKFGVHALVARYG